MTWIMKAEQRQCSCCQRCELADQLFAATPQLRQQCGSQRILHVLLPSPHNDVAADVLHQLGVAVCDVLNTQHAECTDGTTDLATIWLLPTCALSIPLLCGCVAQAACDAPEVLLAGDVGVIADFLAAKLKDW